MKAWGGRYWERGGWKGWVEFDLGAIVLPRIGAIRTGDRVEVWARIGAGGGQDPVVGVTVQVPRPR